MRFFCRIPKTGFLFGFFCLSLFIPVFASNSSASEQRFPKVLMLSQPACPPCHRVSAVLDRLQNEYTLEFEDFNVREDMTVAEKYGAKKTPFLVFFDQEGKEFATHQGDISEEGILAVFAEARMPLKKK